MDPCVNMKCVPTSARILYTDEFGIIKDYVNDLKGTTIKLGSPPFNSLIVDLNHQT